MVAEQTGQPGRQEMRAATTTTGTDWFTLFTRRCSTVAVDGGSVMWTSSYISFIVE